MTRNSLPPLWTISDLNSAAQGMKFGSDYIFYRDFSALRKITNKIVVNFVGFIYVMSGKMAITLNDIYLRAEAGQLIFYKVGDLVSDVLFSPDCEGMLCGMSGAVPFESRSKRGVPQLSSLKGNCKVFDLCEEGQALLAMYCELLSQKYSMGMSNVHYTMISLLEDVLAAVNLPDTDAEKPHTRQSADILYRRFSELLVATYPKPREVQWYADTLSVSPKYLARIVRQISGKSTTQWLNEAMMADIRTALIHTDESIKELSVRLGFNNSAFFGKYVKKHSGMTPMQLRAYLKCRPELR